MGLFPPVTGSTTTAENSDGPNIALTLQKGHERLDDILKAAVAVREYQRKEAVDLLTQFRLLLIVFAGAAIGMAGCSTGLTQMQDTAAKFDQGAHSTGVAQMAFSIKCRRLNAAEIYMYKHSPLRLQKKPETHKYPAVSLNLTLSCTPLELTNDQLKIRQKLIATITLYADTIQTLANGTDDVNLSKNSQDLASNIQGLAKQGGFSAVTLRIGNGSLCRHLK